MIDFPPIYEVTFQLIAYYMIDVQDVKDPPSLWSLVCLRYMLSDHVDDTDEV